MTMKAPTNTGGSTPSPDTFAFLGSVSSHLLARAAARLCSLQPWYEHLEALRYLLPEEDAKDKFTGESWPAKLQRLAERQLVALEDDERRYKEVRVDPVHGGSTCP
jgi:hypothetical protein